MSTENSKLIITLLQMYAYNEAKADSMDFEQNITNLKQTSATGSIFQLSHRSAPVDIIDSNMIRSVKNYKILERESKLF